jgi:hypothetical protein
MKQRPVAHAEFGVQLVVEVRETVGEPLRRLWKIGPPARSASKLPAAFDDTRAMDAPRRQTVESVAGRAKSAGKGRRTGDGEPSGMKL